MVLFAHSQVVEDGYEFFAKRQLVTLFSAPNYCGEFDNAGAMMSVDETLMCSFQVREHSRGFLFLSQCSEVRMMVSQAARNQLQAILLSVVSCLADIKACGEEEGHGQVVNACAAAEVHTYRDQSAGEDFLLVSVNLAGPLSLYRIWILSDGMNSMISGDAVPVASPGVEI